MTRTAAASIKTTMRFGYNQSLFTLLIITLVTKRFNHGEVGYPNKNEEGGRSMLRPYRPPITTSEKAETSVYYPGMIATDCQLAVLAKTKVSERAS